MGKLHVQTNGEATCVLASSTRGGLQRKIDGASINCDCCGKMLGTVVPCYAAFAVEFNDVRGVLRAAT